MKAILQREKHPIITPGALRFNWNHPKIYTLELPWKDNQHDISCIPAGTYTFIPFNSPKHKAWVWKAVNVPLRDDIEIHIANFASNCVFHGERRHSELLGCIAPGFGRDLTVPMLTDSGNAMKYLLTVISGKAFDLEIKDAL